MKAVTIKDVAKKAGVSISVVSYVLNNNPNVSISKETKARVLDAAKSLKYTPNSIARSMRTNKSMVIGLATFWDVSDSVFTDVLKGVDSIAESNGYSVTYCNIKNSFDGQKIVELYNKRQIDGVILLLHVDPAKSFNEIKFINNIKQSGIPAVVIDGNTKEPDTSYVYIDYYGTSYAAVNYLYELGHRKFCYMLPDESETNTIQATQRINGYKDALKNLNLPDYNIYFNKKTICDVINLIKSENISGSDKAIIDRNITCNLPKDDMLTNDKQASDILVTNNPVNIRPTAVVVNKTSYAVHLLKVFIENEIKVPDDVSVIACNNQNYAEFLIPPLSTIKVPTYEMGEKSADILFDILKGKQMNIKLKLSNEVIERQSCRKL
ncbi:MAG TPA: LacI family transcriptional regulator [Clostridiaceae bacterium]|nr:LacI family transcriptional regulator [Clostridiaceae bacterium]